MKYLIGSNYFFGNYEDHQPNDIDYVELVEGEEILRKKKREDGAEIFVCTKAGVLDSLNDCKTSTAFCKLLVPEIAAEVNFTIEDLPKVKVFMDNISKRYSYYKIIYDAYLKNNSFTLTDEQRLEAYECYKKYKL